METYTRYFRSLETEGFFVWPQLLPHRLIDVHLQGFENLNKNLGYDPTQDFYQLSREKQAAIREARYGFHWEHEPTQELIFNPDLISFLRRLFKDEPVVRQPETGFYERRTPVHTDSLDLKVDPPGSEVRIWCALETIRPESGPVFFVPTSHNLISSTLEDDMHSTHPDFAQLLDAQRAPTTAENYFKATAHFWNYIKQDRLPQAIADSQLPRVAPILNKGDVVVFRPDIVHGTSPCSNNRTTRKYLVAYWASRGAGWYHSRAYWGSRHDYRCQQHRITAPIDITARGYRMDFRLFYAAYLDSFTQAINVSRAGRSTV